MKAEKYALKKCKYSVALFGLYVTLKL